MPIFFLAIFLCLSVIGCASGAQKIAQEPSAADPYTWDFGEVKQGEVLKHNFIFKNESAKVINIKGVNTSCGCTASQVQKKTLGPQESTSIEVQFNSKGYVGAVKQFVYVNTDNLDNPLARYIIKANVK